MDFEYVQKYYGVPACFGRRIKDDQGRLGTIVEDRGNYIGVNIDKNKPQTVFNYHPTSVEYLDEIAEPRKLIR